MKYVIILLSLVLLLGTAVRGQKTVHVREYRRKDGTVVKAHDRRPPRSSSPAVIEFKEPTTCDVLDKLSRIGFWEPYEVVDLGGGSFYTPGGTGLTRPRRVKLRLD